MSLYTVTTVVFLLLQLEIHITGLIPGEVSVLFQLVLNL